jgi:hypothetical protein
VDYSLSDVGESLRPVIDILKAWGESHRERLSCAPDPDSFVLPDPVASKKQRGGAAKAAPPRRSAA